MTENGILPEPFPIIAIVGPTGVGKTSISIRLAKRLGGEVVNLDSVQVYKGLDIGSAKPTKKELKEVPHHLIDIRMPYEPLDAQSFSRLATWAIQRIIYKGKVPILVGGTGFYLKSVFEGLSPITSREPAIRKMLKDLLEDKGHEYLFKWLKEVDEKTCEKISSSDTYRLIRALEVYLSTGRPFSLICGEKRPKGKFFGRSVLKIGLIVERKKLYEMIDKRVENMLLEGFIQEVKGLLAKGFSPSLKPLQSIGYKHIISHLQGEKTLDEAIYEMKRDTRRYAKRQITWFKKDVTIRWFNPFFLLESDDIWEAIRR